MCRSARHQQRQRHLQNHQHLTPECVRRKKARLGHSLLIRCIADVSKKIESRNINHLRSLLKAGAIVLILPEKTAVCCEAYGQAMTFLHATRMRHRARPPPAAEPTP
ncbi:MAG: hypothetical protein ABL974_02075 [Prosthecobacter sp.]